MNPSIGKSSDGTAQAATLKRDRRVCWPFGLTSCAALAFAALSAGCSAEVPAESNAGVESAALGGTITLPGRIQAEEYKLGGEGVGYHDTSAGNSGGQYRQDDVDIETTSDTGTGFNVGWTAGGEWLAYSVNVSSAGTYQLTARVASGAAGTKTVGVTLDGVSLGQASFTDASGWQSWRDLPIGTAALSAGSHELRIQMVTGNFNLNYLDATQQSTAISLPGRVQAESYNSGGEGVGYHDTSAGNSGGQFRQDNVDIETSGDTGGGYDVGWTDTGEWLQYTVSVASAGSYQLTARVASGAAGTKTVGVTLDGASLGQASFTDASGWQAWRDLPIGTASLSAGTHTLRLQMVTGGFNLNYLDVTQQATGIAVPGRVQAESYNSGGEGIGYHDTTAGNAGGQYRQDNVDIETTGDAGGGYNVGWTDVGEWLEYTVNVAKTSTYALTARVASGASGSKTLGVTVDGASVGSASFTDASGWQSWQNLQLARTQLSAGTHRLRILAQTGGFNFNYVDVADVGNSDAYGACSDTPKTSKVLVLVYDQYHASIHRDEATHAHAVVDPVVASHQLADIFRQTSHGLVNYQITEVRFFNSQPPQGTPMPGNTADYNAIFQQNNICNLVQTQNLSEVWAWGDNSAGLDEYAYKVPNDAVPNNAQAENPWFYDLRKKNIPDCGKTIWVMGWNYQVGIDNAIHSYNHRVESIVSLLVGQGHWVQNVDPNNPWEKFSRYDKIFPGQAGVGTTHFPPNGSADYDYTNTTQVASTADDFNNYPNLTGATTQVNCNAWGCTQLGYQQWYDSHLPHVTGTGYLNTCNSWWTYIADYDRRNAGCSGASCLQPTGGLCGLNSECASSNCACGQCAAAGTTPSCLGAAFDSCSSASQCGSGICGCPGESAPTECLPNSSYSQTCLQPNGSSCWGDTDCASAICGCNGGSALMCLAAGQSRTCSNVPNWSACLQDADCTSGVCGCNGGPLPKLCLPSTQYPRTCTN